MKSHSGEGRGLWRMEALTPREIVAYLEKYVVGQDRAKRLVAIALRDRYRRSLLSREMQEEIVPKNIMMIGPTGVGKTEIARRLSRLVQAPFVKIEATKFTEVGYMGRDVESLVRDLVETSVRMVREEKKAAVQSDARAAANERLVSLLFTSARGQEGEYGTVADSWSGSGGARTGDRPDGHGSEDDWRRERRERRAEIRRRLLAGEWEEAMVELEVEETAAPAMQMIPGLGEEMGQNLQEMLGSLLPRSKKSRRMTVKAARRYLEQEEAEKLVDMEEVTSEAIQRAENSGIVFLDELDKIASSEGPRSGPDVSREGVQRDILPIVEGSTVYTKYGPVRTDFILFIAAGAFHMSRPSDLIPELQGRFPLRVELDRLGEEDFYRILVQPESALLKQYQALLATEGVTLEFKEEAVRELARAAVTVNESHEDIGARRLHTMLEKLLEDISFNAPERRGDRITVDAAMVRRQLEPILEDRDLSRYIL